MKKITPLLLFYSFCSFADPIHTPTGIPKNLHVYDMNGNTFVDLVTHGCSGTRYYLTPNHPKYDAIVSILLTAQASNKPVIIRFEDCTPQGQGNIVGVYLK
ncbi:hypothetical protein Q4491_04750 [Photobacterium sp. 2_MG-2023]|uniref:hypothetical protein n=1 Tax=unclassified Photobacterium TaxID=2628852 RepID=UPI001C460144|nr:MULTISPECIES: hypothetical protein [unclassified Photobacterium]MBV7262269.1 hypothetical protein [Photobacterium sp. WH24]MDO6580648.1 hypothetical protein [Photobacterium sp. 2_MG-2023]